MKHKKHQPPKKILSIFKNIYISFEKFKTNQ